MRYVCIHKAREKRLLIDWRLVDLFDLLLMICKTPSVTTSLLPAPITRPDAGFSRNCVPWSASLGGFLLTLMGKIYTSRGLLPHAALLDN